MIIISIGVRLRMGFTTFPTPMEQFMFAQFRFTSDRLPLLAGIALFGVFPACAAEDVPGATTLDTIKVTADAIDPDDSRAKTVSSATRIAMEPRDVPQTVNVLEMSKFKVYGLNDLNVLLDGTPGVDTSYDMRGDGIMIRGFAADSNDIYRDGIRNAGQIRRGTANVERIEIVKGPASVLYGRGLGGGVVNLISKQASFDAVSSVNTRAGSWDSRAATVDINRVLSPRFAVRLTADHEHADSFRRGISSHSRMLSPSVLFDNGDGLDWLLQYTDERIWRRPDRAPAHDSLPAGVSTRTAYAHPDDFVADRTRTLRTVLNQRLSDDWTARVTAAWNRSSQDFDHLYAGSYCRPDGTLLANGRPCPTPAAMTFTRAWQETDNTTATGMIDVIGKFSIGRIAHDLLVGVEYSREQRHPDLATSTPHSDPSLRYPHGVDPFHPAWPGPKPPRGWATTSNRHAAEARALYVQDLVTLAPQWKMMAGLRFDRFMFRSHNRINGKQRRYEGSTTSPRLGVIWQPTDAHSLYASYSRNFAPYGGRGLMGVAVSEEAVFDARPQYSRQYEVGGRNDWSQGRLSSHWSIYELELYNVRYQPDPENDPFHWAVRGRERSRGIEGSLTGRLGQAWYVRGGVGLQEVRIVQDRANPANEGRHRQGSAQKTGNLFMRYAPAGAWYGETGVTFRGPIYNDLANTSRRPGYARWDASVGWRTQPWTITLAATNLANSRYWRSTSMPGTPRSLLLSVNYLF